MAEQLQLLGPEKGRIVLRSAASRGFTLVEVLVAVTVLGLLIAFGAPSLSAYMQSARLASAANTYHAALQSARAEAVRRNVPVDFVMTDNDVGTANVENAVISSTSGKNWLIRAAIDPTATPLVYTLIDAKSGIEGSARSTAVLNVSSNGPAGYVGAITFGGFGTPNINGAAIGSPITIDLTTSSGEVCAPVGKMRCPRIRVSPGGQVANCDPVVTDVTDSRYCLP